MVEFCDDCGGMMLPSTTGQGIGRKKILRCKCGATKPINDDESDSYKLKTKIEHSRMEEISSTVEIMNWKEKNLKSTIKNFRCRRCGYDKAHLETKQTRSADEGMTHFITCLRCGKMIKIGS
ncbi:MAG: RPA12/RPB9/RPC11 RNA polymerase family protein [Promethearchaeota archaeon]